VWAIVGWLALAAVGVVLVWYGFIRDGGDSQPVAVQPSLTASVTQVVWPTATLPPPTNPPPPTDTPLPTFAPEPTPIPATLTPVIPYIVTGADGANVRTGPGTNFTRLGYLDPGAQAQVTGRHDAWWQVEYDGAPGWIFGEIVTAFNAHDVPQAQPPPSPTPVPPTETPIPAATSTPAPTPVPGPPAEFHGLVPNDYWVEDAPGPYDVKKDIWFNMDISNPTGAQIDYTALGTWVQETDQFQKSWTHREFTPGKHFVWRDHINIPDAGTYNLWMRICFTDSACVNLMGPITVNVQ